MNHKKNNHDDIATFSVPEPQKIIKVSEIGSLSDISFKTIKEIGQLWESPIVKIIDNTALITTLLYKLKLMAPNDRQKDNIKDIVCAFDSDVFHPEVVPKYGLVILETNAPKWRLNRYFFYGIDSKLFRTLKTTLSSKSENKDLSYQKNKLKLSDDLNKQIESLTKIEPKNQDMCLVYFEFLGEIAPEIDKNTVYFAKL